MSEHLPQQALLDWLRPDTGFQTDIALVSTYSASAGVLASLLISLAGFEDDPSDAGSRATRVKYARSILQLKGRVAIAMQAGRLFSPRKGRKAVAMLDRFIVDMPYDERVKGGQSWHPKCAIIRYTDAKSSSGKWRLWLGSRNLTRDTSWDLGLSIDGYEVGADALDGKSIPSIADTAKKLATAVGRFEDWKVPIRRLRNVQWEVPHGLVVDEIRLMLPGESDRDFPACPDGVSRVVAAAPFMDAEIPKRLGRWGRDAERIIVSAGTELNRLCKGKVNHFGDLGFGFVGDFPAMAEEGEADASDVNQPGIEAPTNSGLHAKFMWMEHARGATMLLGSPNLTERAWKKNAEIFARVSIESRGSPKAGAAIREGIDAFVSMASEFAASPIEIAKEADNALENARNEVVAHLMNARQTLSVDWASVDIRCPDFPHPADQRIVLKIGSLADDIEQMTEWQHGSKVVRFRPQDPQAASHLMRVKIERRGLLPVVWLQSIPIDGFEQDRRDRQLLRQYLSDDELMTWIYKVLTGNSDGAEGGPWDDDDPKHATYRRGQKRIGLAPTLEDLLRAWVRNRSAFDQIDEIVDIFESKSSEAGNRPAIASFRASLALVKQTLNAGTAR